MLQIWGRDRSVIGMPLVEIMPEIADQPFPRILDHVFTTGKIYSETDSQAYLKRHGRMETIYVDFTYKPLRDENGEVMSILIMAIEVTDRVLTRQQLIQSESNLRNTIRRAPVGMCILRGPQYVVEIANDRMIEIWGRPLADVLNKPIFEGLPEARSQGFEQLLAGVYTSGNAFAANGLPIVLPRGAELAQIYVNFVYEAYREPNGTISGIIAIVNEVTEQVIARQKIEELVAERTKELAAANYHLEKSNAELSQFAHIASHDLQEPIRKITIYTELLESSLSGTFNDQSKEYLNKINAAGSRMIQLIRDVLAYSELSDAAPTFEPVDLQQILYEVQSEFELLIEQKGARISYTGLPIIAGIPMQMTQLFGNLLSNALKYAKVDIPPIVAITSQTEGHFWHIQVTDNGIGFDPKHAGQIFSIFQRLHRKNEYSGTGIGLALCKKIIQNHHGEIYATSEPGQGSTFHILLPAIAAS
jgi:signal transduction histidine kinase